MRIALYTGALATLVGCSVTDPELDGPAQTGAALSVDYFGDTDVEGFEFFVERVACYPGEYFRWEHYKSVVDLVDGIFPGQIDFVEETLDPSSRHLGADFFVTLSPGCYDVIAKPVTNVNYDYYDHSYDCSAVKAEGVVVEASQTTDVVLVSQCVGDPIGALDTLVLLNHPPGFDLFIDEKFNYECEPVNVCAIIEDVDDDPIRVEWDVSPSEWDITVHDPVIVGFDDGHRIWKACAEIVTRYTQAYDVTLTVYDVGWGTDEFGNPIQVDLEDIVQADWSPSTVDEEPPTSHATLQFPIYTNWIEEPLCFDEFGKLGWAEGVYIERAAGCDYIDAEEYYCSGNYDVDPDILPFLCDGTDLIEEALYPPCDGVEVCDDKDNDGDGYVDEGYVSGESCTYEDDHISGTNGKAGEFDLVRSTYDSAKETWAFRTELSHNGGTTDAFTIAISDGANPKGNSELALAYVDCTGSLTEPNITVYTYNGLNTFTSYEDGNGDGVAGDPDQIVNSQDDDSFVISSSCDDDGKVLTVDFVLDVSGINSHVPVFVAKWDWLGFQHDHNFGIWMHPWEGGSFTYDADGWITAASYAQQGWFDASWLPASCDDVCYPAYH
ncbi:MAG: hypothetical protein KTR31_17630 [Myxococcales bacterium]|nr:hypothetical protein [Myxococcales bacterium]